MERKRKEDSEKKKIRKKKETVSSKKEILGGKKDEKIKRRQRGRDTVKEGQIQLWGKERKQQDIIKVIQRKSRQNCVENKRKKIGEEETEKEQREIGGKMGMHIVRQTYSKDNTYSIKIKSRESQAVKKRGNPATKQ